MTQNEVYTILQKHNDKLSYEEYCELSNAIAEYGFNEWKEGRENIQKIYNL